MEYLRDNYLKNVTGDDKIGNDNDNDDNIIVKCSSNEVSKLKRLNFVLSEKTVLPLPTSSLFKCGNFDECVFVI